MIYKAALVFCLLQFAFCSASLSVSIMSHNEWSAWVCAVSASLQAILWQVMAGDRNS